MELIELKSAWDLLQQDVINNDKVEESKIITSIHSKSKSEISKIKRVLYLKFIVASLSIVVAIGLALISFMNTKFNPLDFIFSPLESSIFFLIMALSISIMVYFNYNAYSQIKDVQSSSSNLKANLESFIEAMKNAIAFNIFSDTVMTPIIATWVYYAYAFKNQLLGFDLRTGLLIILPFVIAILSYFFQRFIQHLKFGKYLNRLDGYLNSLQRKSSKL
jgi:hypothetical protein